MKFLTSAVGLVTFTAALARDPQAPLSESSSASSAKSPQSRPNIVFFLADDQDVHLDSLAYQPAVHRHLIDEGLTFRRHFCTVALCCPSRVNLWTGKAAHNTNVTDINPPYGRYPKMVMKSQPVRLMGLSRRLPEIREPGFKRPLSSHLAPGSWL